MLITFYIAAVVAVISTLMVITRTNVVHALLYLVVSLLSTAIIFYAIGAPFIAALEVIIYAGAIMVLFIFVVMMLNVGKQAVQQESQWLNPKAWIGPILLTLILFFEFFYLILISTSAIIESAMVTPKEVGMALYSKYLLGVELSAMLLLAGIVGAYHLGHRTKKVVHRFLEEEKSL
jgi:NADH-quinone oxidoreductase subunit J